MTFDRAVRTLHDLSRETVSDVCDLAMLVVLTGRQHGRDRGFMHFSCWIRAFFAPIVPKHQTLNLQLNAWWHCRLYEARKL